MIKGRFFLVMIVALIIGGAIYYLYEDSNLISDYNINTVIKRYHPGSRLKDRISDDSTVTVASDITYEMLSDKMRVYFGALPFDIETKVLKDKRTKELLSQLDIAIRWNKKGEPILYYKNERIHYKGK